MQKTTTQTLMQLSESDLTLADTAEDVRGHTVIDSDGEELGDVSDLLLDDREHKVRFIQVEAGGFLGIGSRTFTIPVDAISSVEDERITLGTSKAKVIDGPAYDPEVMHEDVNENRYWGDVYGWYGYSPYWTPGYRYPGFPYYRPVA